MSIILSLMALTVDSRPSLYLDYLAKPPQDADWNTLKYLSDLKPYILISAPRGLTSLVESVATQDRTGRKNVLRTTKRDLVEVASACRRYGLIHNLVNNPDASTQASGLFVTTDEFANFFAITYEAEVRQQPQERLRGLIRLRKEQPQVYWTEMADTARTNLGNHPLRELIRTPKEIAEWLMRGETESDDIDIDQPAFHPNQAPFYPWPPFLGSSRHEFAEEAIAIMQTGPTDLRRAARTEPTSIDNHLLEALRVGYDHKVFSETGKRRITQPEALPGVRVETSRGLVRGTTVGVVSLLEFWQHYPDLPLNHILNKMVRQLNIEYSLNPQAREIKLA